MTRLEALEQTYEAVDRGNVHLLCDDVTATAFGVKPYDEKVGYVRLIVARRFEALSAAQSLHEAVLPGWRWAIANDALKSRAVVQRDFTLPGVDASDDTPARAWLLAILKAKLVDSGGREA